MTEKTYRISGKIVGVKSRAGIPGLRVEAWDKDLIFDDLVGSAFADGQGVFAMTFDESYFREIFVDRRPDLYFKVFRDKELLKNTRDSTWWNAPQGDVSITIEIDSSHEGAAWRSGLSCPRHRARQPWQAGSACLRASL